MSRKMILGAVAVLAVVPVVSAQTVLGGLRGEQQFAQQPAVRPLTLKLLDQQLPEVQFVEQPLEQVVDWLAELTQINFVVRWQTLEDAGIDRDTPISLKVRNLRLAQVLWLIMNEAGGTEIRLAYRATGRLLVLSTEEDLNKEMVTKVYDVSDLLIEVPNASRDTGFDVSQALSQTGQGGTGGGGTNVWGENNNENDYNNNDENNREGQSQQMDDLVELITSTVEPDSWIINGGQGSIRPYRKLLIVHNTILVHQLIGGYLAEGEVAGP